MRSSGGARSRSGAAAYAEASPACTAEPRQARRVDLIEDRAYQLTRVASAKQLVETRLRPGRVRFYLMYSPQLEARFELARHPGEDAQGRVPRAGMIDRPGPGGAIWTRSLAVSGAMGVYDHPMGRLCTSRYQTDAARSV